MTELRTEEEQIELIKHWWRDNGKAIIIALILSVGSIGGWKWWQADQAASAQAASSAYEQLMNVMNKPELTDEERATAQHLAVTLQEEHKETLYASYAALFEAKLLVDDQQLDAALTVLKKAQAEAVTPLIKEIASVREAQILWQQDKSQQALDLLNGLVTSAYTGNAEELKGDILAEMGRNDDARNAYEKAKTAFNTSGVARPVIEMKLADLGA
ncbi:YfgM family protein [Oceanospirillum maris]|uniref:YfgM family protein n=1 Tax=Oceanospirillum maris TaxID=64977 RepID=UPI0003F93173|nr:tetratricopeptide repeat protein [Oceanospirillum maris]